MPLFQTITNPTADLQSLRERAYGVIDVREGSLAGIRLRPYPKLISLPEIWWAERRRSRTRADACRLYYNQPWSCRDFLSVTYAEAQRGASLASIHEALRWLDEIARLKGSLAIVADISNFRITPRALARYGWEPLVQTRWRRPYIKRFYGDYPAPLTELESHAFASATASCSNE